jgi:hypothetical protein
VIPEADEFKNLLKFKIPSVDDMYDNKEFADYRQKVTEKHNDIDMHDEFLILMVDTFNVSMNDKLLQQNALNLICRYYSERWELVRNVDRMLLLFNEEEWLTFQFVNKTADDFSRVTERCDMWLNDLEDFDEEDYINRAIKLLVQLKRVIYYKYTIEYNESEGKYVLNKIPGERKINPFIQKVFRNVKVYDHMINFIKHNFNLLSYVRTVDNDTLEKEVADKVDKVEEVFYKCITVLQAFVLRNTTNQNLMWKYKEFFVFPSLGASEQDGELDFVYAIIDGNENIEKEKSFSQLIQNLNKRMGHKANFIMLLDIFNKLMDYEITGGIK